MPGVARLLADPELIEAAQLQRSLASFSKAAWHVVEPHRKLVWGWSHDAICDHLQAVSEGQITRLLINVPPRMTKSLFVASFWPAWSWARDPGLRFLFSSYAHGLASRDSLRCRRIVESDWYVKRWGHRVQLAEDQNVKNRYDTTAGGSRLATSVGGATTGEGGDVVAVDDPHNVLQALSDAQRREAITWWDEAMSTRLNDPATGALVVVGQRVHDDDLSAHLIESGDYVHLELPMSFDPERRCSTVIGFQDPRTQEGELLEPTRFPKAVVERLTKALGPHAAAAQLEQQPTPRTGGMFHVERFQVVRTLPAGDPVVKRLRAWDKAGTENAGCETAGVRMALLESGRVVVEHVVAGQWSVGTREATILQTAQVDGARVRIWIEQEPGSGGKESAEATIRNLRGFRAKAERVTGDKPTRAEPYADQIEGGNVLLLDGPWVASFIDAHRRFPAGMIDQADAAASAFNALVGRRRITFEDLYPAKGDDEVTAP